MQNIVFKLKFKILFVKLFLKRTSIEANKRQDFQNSTVDIFQTRFVNIAQIYRRTHKGRPQIKKHVELICFAFVNCTDLNSETIHSMTVFVIFG